LIVPAKRIIELENGRGLEFTPATILTYLIEREERRESGSSAPTTINSR